jgi:hypothetical protein
MTEWISEWNRRVGGKIMRNENLTTPRETRTADIFPAQIPHAQYRTEVGPPPWQTGDWAPKPWHKKLRRWVCLQ